jgi:hypothetical protein
MPRGIELSVLLLRGFVVVQVELLLDVDVAEAAHATLQFADVQF